ncbi:MAG: transcriptional regulator [Robiginitomaculum sp.]|nr:MAG: transcriptional regulator [Robiginitomaculum sp.]
MNARRVSLLGNHLKEYRARYSLTQQQLAERVGVTRKTINTVENAVFIPSTVLALKMAQVLETTVENLFFLPAAITNDQAVN